MNKKPIIDVPDQLVAYLQIEVYKSGALSVSGSIQNEKYALNALDSAKDAVRNHHKTKSSLIIPGKDTGLENGQTIN